jgi:L,D-transpeptidase ErfK/SrfK
VLRASSLIGALVVVSLHSPVAFGEEFWLPDHPRDGVVGEVRYTRVSKGDSLLDIARAFDLGHDQIINANPELNRWVPEEGAEVVLPSLYVLPEGERKGIVLNLAELRLYYFQPERRLVHTFPVSIGDVDWRTPLGQTRVVSKEIDPAWSPPKSIRAEHTAEGEELPTIIPGGDPDNPLGHFALKLGIPGYLIHGTDARRSFGIGMRVSHGCIRLYPEDMERLFEMIKIGTTVRIVDQPVKAAWHGDQLYLEIHQPLSEDDHNDLQAPSIPDVATVLAKHLKAGVEVSIEEIEEAQRVGSGIPVVVARRYND